MPELIKKGMLSEKLNDPKPFKSDISNQKLVKVASYPSPSLRSNITKYHIIGQNMLNNDFF